MENVQNEYELTTDELGMIKPMIEAVDNLQKETQAVLRAITRLRNLQGQWNLVGDKLVKIETNGHLQ
jgi:hypothetical protein